jgi:pyridoxamine 5'-phosphate oxidase-like protein
VSWAAFEAAAPELAAGARRLIFRSGQGSVLLATVRDDEPPRIHPISVAIVDGRLLAFIIKAGPKRRDLEADGRYAMHSHLDLAAPDEVSVRGHATLVPDQAARDAAIAVWPFEADDDYALFEFAVESCVLGLRGADEWPPRYTTWRATPA